MVFGICQCGAFASYPHAEDCPYPMFRNDTKSISEWEKAHSELVGTMKEGEK
jgi:hypothetical protein